MKIVDLFNEHVMSKGCLGMKQETMPILSVDWFGQSGLAATNSVLSENRFYKKSCKLNDDMEGHLTTNDNGFYNFNEKNKSEQTSENVQRQSSNNDHFSTNYDDLSQKEEKAKPDHDEKIKQFDFENEIDEGNEKIVQQVVEQQASSLTERKMIRLRKRNKSDSNSSDCSTKSSSMN